GQLLRSRQFVVQARAVADDSIEAAEKPFGCRTQPVNSSEDAADFLWVALPVCRHAARAWVNAGSAVVCACRWIVCSRLRNSSKSGRGLVRIWSTPSLFFICFCSASLSA